MDEVVTGLKDIGNKVLGKLFELQKYSMILLKLIIN